jgi:RHS repeat-associated protein
MQQRWRYLLISSIVVCAVILAPAVVLIASQSVAQFGFTGEWTNVDATISLRARAYAPHLGRFLQRDRFAGFLSQPSSLNRYAYADNNPTMFVDPSGFCTCQEDEAWDISTESLPTAQTPGGSIGFLHIYNGTTSSFNGGVGVLPFGINMRASEFAREVYQPLGALDGVPISAGYRDVASMGAFSIAPAGVLGKQSATGIFLGGVGYEIRGPQFSRDVVIGNALLGVTAGFSAYGPRVHGFYGPVQERTASQLNPVKWDDLRYPNTMGYATPGGISGLGGVNILGMNISAYAEWPKWTDPRKTKGGLSSVRLPLFGYVGITVGPARGPVRCQDLRWLQQETANNQPLDLYPWDNIPYDTPMGGGVWP